MRQNNKRKWKKGQPTEASSSFGIMMSLHEIISTRYHCKYRVNPSIRPMVPNSYTWGRKGVYGQVFSLWQWQRWKINSSSSLSLVETVLNGNVMCWDFLNFATVFIITSFSTLLYYSNCHRLTITLKINKITNYQ